MDEALCFSFTGFTENQRTLASRHKKKLKTISAHFKSIPKLPNISFI